MKYIKLDPNVPDLIRGSAEAAGIDLYNAGEPLTIKSNSSAVLDTGISVQIPSGFFGLCVIRSSLGFKYNLGSHVGIIDSDFRGQMKVKIFNAVGDDVFIDKYDRVAQLVIIPYDTSQPEEVDELDHTERGHGGYGSTGKK